MAANDDYSSDSSHPGTLLPGGQANWTFEAAGDIDVLRIPVTYGYHYQLTLSGGDYSVDFALRDAAGNSVSHLVRDSLDALHFNADRTGDYYLTITDKRYQFSPGSYSVTASQGLPDEGADGWGPFGTMTVGTTTSGVFGFAKDIDTYKIQLEAGVTYRLDTAWPGAVTTPTDSPDRPTGYWWSLGSIDGYPMMATEQHKKVVTFTPHTSGKYSVSMATEYFQPSATPYLVSVTPVQDDYRGSAVGAGKLPMNGQAAGQLEVNNDADWFAMDLEAGIDYVFSMKLDASASRYSTAAMVVVDANGKYMQPYAVGGSSATSTYSPTVSGTYYLQVENLHEPSSVPPTAYVVTAISAQGVADDYPATKKTTGVLPIGGTVSGQVDFTSDRDWFKLYLHRGLQYEITLGGKETGEGTMAVGEFGAKVFLPLPDLGTGFGSLYNNDGKFLKYTLTTEMSGTQYLAVYDDAIFSTTPAAGYHTGTYVLHAELLPKSTGGNGDDLLAGRGTGATITGGTGLDTTVYGGMRTAYTVTHNEAVFNVSRTGATSADSLTGVERLLFNDSAVALDINGAGGQAYRLYQAAFDRTPDKAGIGYWMARMDKGASVYQVAQSFINSAEFGALYGTESADSTFIGKLCLNVLHRAPDQSGMDYWTGVLTSGIPRAAVLASFSESPENQAAVLQVIGNGFAYTPYG